MMNRIDVHCHFLPALDDGCATLEESIECLRMMAQAGYSRVFLTPHCGAQGAQDPSTAHVAELVSQLARHVAAQQIPIELKPGGELRLSPHIAEELPRQGVPTYGHAGKYVLADSWDDDWPAWATRAVEWLQKRGYIVILAHPERMPVLLREPAKIDELARLGLLFQGNLGPLGGADAPRVVALAQRFLQEGRYFMVGSDGHRPGHLAARLAGLARVEELAGAEKLEELTVKNPSRLWG
jgi:protein-tyrosine phosphatase